MTNSRSKSLCTKLTQGALAAIISTCSVFGPANATDKPGAWSGDMPFFGWPEPIDNAVDALTLYYLNAKIYRAVDCDPELVEGYVFVRCFSVGHNIMGGIFVLTNAFDDVSTLPLNGKAKTHLRDRNYVTDVDNQRINILSVENQAALDVQIAAPLSAAIEAFGR